MKFAVGDMVSFLDEKLTGVVTRIINPKTCRVQTSEGMEADVPANKLVLMQKHVSSEAPADNDFVQAAVADNAEALAPGVMNALADEALHLVALPAENMQTLTGPVNFYLVNKTPYSLFFSFSVKTKLSTSGIASGKISAHSLFFLLTKPRADITEWENFKVQAIFFNTGAYVPVHPLNREASILLPDLTSQNYMKSVQLFSVGKQHEIDLKNLQSRLIKDNAVTTKVSPKIAPAKKEHHLPGVLYNDAVIDLHIQQLAVHYTGLSNAEMLEVQLKKFRQEMEHAIRNHYHRIIFIHGVGSGVLKAEIIRELKIYPGIKYRDAAAEKFGYGATEVILI